MSKIVLITMEYPPYFGGVGTYYFNLIKNLPFTVKVLADKKNLIDSQTQNDVVYLDLLNKIGPLKWLKIVNLLRKLSNKPGKKIVWAGNLLPVGTACLIAKKLFNLDYFVSLHGLDWQSANINSRKKYLANKILKSALFITTNSYATTNLLPDQFKNKAQVIYPAASVNSSAENNNFLTENKLNEKKYFLSVSRLVARKGHKQLIQAWKNIALEHPDYKLTIVGSGPMNTELNELINELNLNGQVSIINNATDEQVSTLYSNAYCFILPVQPLKNDIEGFGIVCLEAQLYGLPVITTKTGGVVEAMNDSALFLNQGTVDEIFSTVNELISNNDLRESLIKKSLVNEKIFSWQNSAKILNDILTKYE